MASSGTGPVVARKHVELSLELKRKLIQEHELGVPFALLGKKYHIATSTAANIWRKKEFFLRSRMSGSRKRCNDRSKYKLVNQVTAIFVRNMLQTDHKIDGEVIKRFARTAASQCNFGDFHGSNGWLDSFKKRENVRWVKRRNQKSSLNNSGSSDHNDEINMTESDRSLDNNSILNARCVRMGDVIRSKLGLHSSCDISCFQEDEREMAAMASLESVDFSQSSSMDRDSIIDEWFLGIPLLCRIFQEKQDRKTSNDIVISTSSGNRANNVRSPSSLRFEEDISVKGKSSWMNHHQIESNVVDLTDQMDEYCQSIDKDEEELIVLATQHLEQTAAATSVANAIAAQQRDQLGLLHLDHLTNISPTNNSSIDNNNNSNNSCNNPSTIGCCSNGNNSDTTNNGSLDSFNNAGQLAMLQQELLCNDSLFEDTILSENNNTTTTAITTTNTTTTTNDNISAFVKSSRRIHHRRQISFIEHRHHYHSQRSTSISLDGGDCGGGGGDGETDRSSFADSDDPTSFEHNNDNCLAASSSSSSSSSYNKSFSSTYTIQQNNSTNNSNNDNNNRINKRIQASLEQTMAKRAYSSCEGGAYTHIINCDPSDVFERYSNDEDEFDEIELRNQCNALDHREMSPKMIDFKNEPIDYDRFSMDDNDNNNNNNNNNFTTIASPQSHHYSDHNDEISNNIQDNNQIESDLDNWVSSEANQQQNNTIVCDQQLSYHLNDIDWPSSPASSINHQCRCSHDSIRNVTSSIHDNSSQSQISINNICETMHEQQQQQQQNEDNNDRLNEHQNYCLCGNHDENDIEDIGCNDRTATSPSSMIQIAAFKRYNRNSISINGDNNGIYHNQSTPTINYQQLQQQQQGDQYDNLSAMEHLDIDSIHDGSLTSSNLEQGFGQSLFTNTTTTTANNSNDMCLCNDNDDLDHDDHCDHDLPLDRFTVIKSVITLLHYANKFNPCILDLLMKIKRSVEQDLNMEVLSDQYSCLHDPISHPDDRLQYD